MFMSFFGDATNLDFIDRVEYKLSPFGEGNLDQSNTHTSLRQ